jgi:hypothetical protein
MTSITVPITGATAADFAALNTAIQAALAPPVVTPPTPVADVVLYANGKGTYEGLWNYGDLEQTDGMTFAGEVCAQFVAAASGGGGGFLPYFALPELDTTGYLYRHLRLAYTRVGQVWQAVQPYMHAPNPTDTGDIVIPGTLSVNIVPPVGINTWFDLYIPLRAGGYNMVPIQVIKKWGIQDQINSSGNNAALGHGNTWYMAYDALTVTKPA